MRFCLLSLVVLLAFSGKLDAQESRKRLTIVCSTTQVADFARQVVGDYCEVKCILAPGEACKTIV